MRGSFHLLMITVWLTGVLSEAGAQEAGAQEAGAQEAGAQEAGAQELDPRLYPRFELDVSGTLLLLGEDIRIDPQNRPELGTTIDAEDVLGVSKTSLQPRATLRWRPGRRHELELGFLRVVRSAEKVLADTIAFADTSFAAGLRLNSNLRTSQAFLAYRYAFRIRPTSQIGAGIALGAIFFRQQLDAVAGVTGGGADTTIVPYSQTRTLTAPTGSLGVYGRFKLGERWYLDSDVRAIYVKIDNFKAVVAEVGVAGRRFFSDKFAAELGYSLGLYTVTVERTAGQGFLGIDLAGKIKYSVNGFRGGLVILF
jgi:hypothetical protein